MTLRRLFRRNISLAGLSKGPSGRSLGLAPVCAMRLFSAATKVGAFFNSQRLVMNIANDMRLRLKHHFAALDGSLYLTVHDHPLCSDTSDDVGLRRDNERIAMQGARARRDNNYETLWRSHH